MEDRRRSSESRTCTRSWRPRQRSRSCHQEVESSKEVVYMWCGSERITWCGQYSGARYRQPWPHVLPSYLRKVVIPAIARAHSIDYVWRITLVAKDSSNAKDLRREERNIDGGRVEVDIFLKWIHFDTCRCVQMTAAHAVSTARHSVGDLQPLTSRSTTRLIVFVFYCLR